MDSQQLQFVTGWEYTHQLLDSSGGITELIASNGRLERRVHKDIGPSHHAIPVQNSISKDDELRASQYCFLSRSRNEFNIDYCKDEAHCADSSKMQNGNDMMLKNVSLDWNMMKDIDTARMKNAECQAWESEISAASYQDLVFFKKVSSIFLLDDLVLLDDYLEVIQLDPATMETSTIFLEKGHVRHGDELCVHRDCVHLLKFFNGICGLVFASYYLIAKLGMVSGVFPLVYAFSFVLFMLVDEAIEVSFLTFMGTGFLLYLIVTDRKWDKLPAWIGKDVYTWALYGWISSNSILPFVPNYMFRHTEELKVVYWCISALILGHPVIQMLGYIFVIFGVLEIIFDFEYFLMDPWEALSPILSGLGLVVSGNWITAHKEVIYARGKYVFWYLKKWFRVRFRRNLSRR